VILSTPLLHQNNNITSRGVAIVQLFDIANTILLIICTIVIKTR